MILTVFLIFVTIFGYIWATSRNKNNNFPPGPIRLPIIGSLAALYSRKKKAPEVILSELSKKYGNLVGLYIGSRRAVLVNGFASVKHVLSREECSYRIDSLMIRQRSFNKRLGILFADGHIWKEQRRFTLRHLRDFGFGKRSMESLIHDEVATLIRKIEDRLAETWDAAAQGIEIQDLFPVSVINILWAIIAGVRFDHADEKFKNLIKYVDDFVRNGTPTGGIVSLFPLFRFVPIINSSFKKQVKAGYGLQQFMKQTINEHKSSYDENEMRDLIDVYIREIKLQGDNSTFTEEQLIVTCMDLFIGGTDTTSTALAFIFLYLLKYPEVQEKLRAEILSIIGTTRIPNMGDVSRLNYVQAFVHEVLRHACMVPFTVPHNTSTDIKLFQYDIPKNTCLMINLHSVFKDENYWHDPETFRPERFLTEEGIFKKDEQLMTFGYGPRVCMGEPLAKASIFLFLTTILQKFICKLPTNSKHLSMEQHKGFINSPLAYKIYFDTNTSLYM